jgi:hypothetical protein
MKHLYYMDWIMCEGVVIVTTPSSMTTNKWEILVKLLSCLLNCYLHIIHINI